MAKFDVVKEYDWTSSPRGSGMRTKAPRVWVKSYKLETNSIMTAVENYINIAKTAGGSAKEFYDNMYGNGVTTPEDDFNFPFFGDEVRSFGNTFGDTFQNGLGEGGGVGTALDNIAKSVVSLGAQAIGAAGSDNVNNAVTQAKAGNYMEAFQTVVKGIKGGGDPGSYVETPMFYQFEKSDGPLNVSFVLANTINADSVSKNKALIDKLTRINRPLRKNSIAVDPPRIYQVKVPGHRFIKWAYCEQFSVKLLGTRREINNVIVPEAYQIDMSFKSLTLEHAGFMDEV